MATSVLRACASSSSRVLSLRPLALSSSLRPASSTQADNEPPKGFVAKYMGPSSAVASDPAKTNRWAMFVPAFATHVCLGAPYGWSAISAALSREYGVVAASSADWVLDQCTYPMSIMVRDEFNVYFSQGKGGSFHIVYTKYIGAHYHTVHVAKNWRHVRCSSHV